MNKEFDVKNYVKILKEIIFEFSNLKNDNTNEELYSKLKSSLGKLRNLLDNNLIPSKLLYETEKFYCDYYRLMEATYVKTKNK